MEPRYLALLVGSAAGMASLIAGFVLRLGASYLVVLGVVGGGVLAYGLVKGLKSRRERGGAEPSREETENAYAVFRNGLILFAIGGCVIVALALAYLDGSTLSSVLILGGWALMLVCGIPIQLRLVREYREKLETAG